MKCRRINPENGMIVWFGVKDVKKALKASNSAIASDKTIVSKDLTVFQNDNDRHDNYASNAEAVAMSLKQRLSVLKNELWYDYDNGMPLVDNIRSKAIVDSYVISTVLSHPDVLSIDGFESEQVQHSYSCYLIVSTIYGKAELGL